jgi:hypothetical protein
MDEVYVSLLNIISQKVVPHVYMFGSRVKHGFLATLMALVLSHMRGTWEHSSPKSKAPVDDFVLLFLPPCGPHLTPLATGSLESGLLVSSLLGGPARHRPFAPTLHLHQRTSSRNLHLQYSAKSQSTPCCQSLITARSDHPPVLGRSGPQERRR